MKYQRHCQKGKPVLDMDRNQILRMKNLKHLHQMFIKLKRKLKIKLKKNKVGLLENQEPKCKAVAFLKNIFWEYLGIFIIIRPGNY